MGRGWRASGVFCLFPRLPPFVSERGEFTKTRHPRDLLLLIAVGFEPFDHVIGGGGFPSVAHAVGFESIDQDGFAVVGAAGGVVEHQVAVLIDADDGILAAGGGILVALDEGEDFGGGGDGSGGAVDFHFRVLVR